MAKKIVFLRLRWISMLVVVSIAAVFCVGLIAQRHIMEQAKKRDLKMARIISENSVSDIQTYLQQYFFYLNDISNIAEKGEEGDNALTSIFTDLTKKDSTIEQVWVNTCDAATLGGDCQASLRYTENTAPGMQVICRSRYKNNVGKEFGLKINLLKFHEKIAESFPYSDAYIVLSTLNGITLFHPNEKLIGKKDAESAVIFSNGNKYQLDNNVPSEYLKIDVFRYSTHIPFAGTMLIVSTYVPTFDFVELVGKMQRNLWLMIVVPILLILIIAAFAIRAWRNEFIKSKMMEKEAIALQLVNEQQRLQMRTSELENLKSGVNPHFLFNSLGSLRALIKRNPDEALSFTQALSSMYRYLLETENKNTILLSKEIEFTKNYIDIQKIRFKETISFSINVTNAEQCEVPPLAVQTLVENCIKHNNASTNLPLCISIYNASGYLFVINNINRRAEVVESTGKGQNNLVKRYSYLTDVKCVFYEKNGEYIAQIPLL